MRKAIEANNQEADVLIAMHRVPNAPVEWTKLTKQYVDAASLQMRRMCENMDQHVRTIEDERERAMMHRALATYLNQYAWLVGNTGGDVNAAIAASHRSLELRPDTAGFLDTLAHCYYAKGDFESAVKHQTRAVELEPHTMILSRALDKFRKALEESKKSEN